LSQPLVSVAIATFNGRRFLADQITSILAQSWGNLEIVVSDDASTDGTIDLLEELGRRAPIRYSVNRSRLGLVRNFERALSQCSGSYVALCDQDDVWKPHKVQTLVGALGDNMLVYCNVQEMLGRDGHHRIAHEFEPICEFSRQYGSGSPTCHLIAENWVVGHSVLFRRELLDQALPIPAHQPYHDGWLALVASKLGGIRFVDERLQIYRQHEDSLTWAEPGTQIRGSSLPAALVHGELVASWRRRCEWETARLRDVLAHPVFDSRDKEFAAACVAYYRAGLEPGHRWSAARNGLKIAPFFSSLHGNGGRWKLPAKPLLLGR
jgi:hypothetical protein